MTDENQPIRCREDFFPRAPRSVPTAREFVRAALAAWSVREGMDDVLLCVSELTTNALAHGGPPDGGFVLRVTATAIGLVHVEVHDAGEGQPRLGEWSDDQEHGRGLWLVEALADKWGVTHCHPGKFVWAEFRVTGASQGPGDVPDRPGMAA